MGTRSQIGDVATNQKVIIWLIAVNLVLVLTIPLASTMLLSDKQVVNFILSVFPLLLILTGILYAIFVHRLATSLNMVPAIAWVFLSMLPYVGVIALLIVNGKATRFLRSKSIRVGLMGADSDDVNRAMYSRLPPAGDEADECLWR